MSLAAVNHEAEIEIEFPIVTPSFQFHPIAHVPNIDVPE
jgi:hypothetical protein